MQLLGLLTAVLVATVLDLLLPASVNQTVNSLETAVTTLEPSVVISTFNLLQYSCSNL